MAGSPGDHAKRWFSRWSASFPAILLGWGCVPASTAPPRERASAEVGAAQPSAEPPRAEPVCALADVPAHASVASRALERDLGASGPWFVGESIFEYVRPSPRGDAGYENVNTRGGRSRVLLGPPLEVVMPANETLPSESLLRFGPPAAIAFRAEAAGDYRVAFVACPRSDAATLALQVEALRDSVDAISTLGADQLTFTGAPTRPRVDLVWAPSEAELSRGFTVHHDVHLEAGDVVRLSVFGWPRPGSSLRVAFDLAVWPLGASPSKPPG